MTQVRRSSADAPIDVRVLDEHTGADAILKQEVLALFIAQGVALHALAAHTRSSDDLVSGLHRIKGAARAVGAHRLAAGVERCEGEIASVGNASRHAVAAVQDAITDACRYAETLVTGLTATSSPNGRKAGKHHQPSVSHSGKPGARKAED